MQTIPFSEARAQLADVMRGVETGEPMVISRRGQASSVLMSLSQYQQLSGEGLGFSERLDRWRATQLSLAQLEDSDPFEDVRQGDDSRNFEW